MKISYKESTNLYLDKDTRQRLLEIGGGNMSRGARTLLGLPEPDFAITKKEATQTMIYLYNEDREVLKSLAKGNVSKGVRELIKVYRETARMKQEYEQMKRDLAHIRSLSDTSPTIQHTHVPLTVTPSPTPQRAAPPRRAIARNTYDNTSTPLPVPVPSYTDVTSTPVPPPNRDSNPDVTARPNHTLPPNQVTRTAVFDALSSLPLPPIPGRS